MLIGLFEVPEAKLGSALVLFRVAKLSREILAFLLAFNLKPPPEAALTLPPPPLPIFKWPLTAAVEAEKDSIFDSSARSLDLP
jgi:hypothetical protein